MFSLKTYGFCLSVSIRVCTRPQSDGISVDQVSGLYIALHSRLFQLIVFYSIQLWYSTRRDPGNRFYPALHASALTPTLLSPFDSHTLPEYGLGLTDVVDRATNAESKLSIPEKRAGIAKLREKIVRFRPRVVAFVGMDTFRHAFNLPKCTVGLQSGRLGGAAVWVLPSTSGLNANHQLKDLAVLFGELKKLAFSDEKLELGPELVEGGIEVKEEEEVEGTAEGGEPRSVSGKGKRKSPSSPKTPSKQRKIVDLGSPLEGKSAVIEELLVEDEPAEEPDRPLETPVKRKRVSMGIAA